MSNEVLSSFDNLMYLTKEGLVYNGPYSGIRETLTKNNIDVNQDDTPLDRLQANADVIARSLAINQSSIADALNEQVESLPPRTKKLGCGKTFCMLFKRNFRFYGSQLRPMVLFMALVSILIQVCFFYSLGSVENPLPSTVMLFALDTFVVTCALQIVTTIETTRTFKHEMQVLDMQYSAHSFFLATWFSSIMNIKVYPVTVSSIIFWFLAWPSPTWWNWFQFVCIYLVLTMMSASWGQMLGIIFSKRTALLIHFYMTMVFIITSGAVISITETTNPFIK